MTFTSGDSPLHSEWFSLQGSLLQANGIRLLGVSPLSRGFPSPSEWYSPQGTSPIHSEWDSLQGSPPPPKRMVFSSRGFPLHSEWDSLQRIPLVNSEWNSHQLRNPLQVNGIRTKRVTLSKANGIRIKRVTLSKANEIRTKGSPSPSEWDSHQEGRPLQSEWDSLLTSGLVAARDPFQGTLLRGHATQGIPFSLRLSEWYSLQEIFILPNNNVWVGGLRFSSTTHSFRASSRDPSVKRPHSWFSPTHPYSPLWRDKEAEDTSIPGPVTAMMDFGFFTEQGSGFPLLPISIKRALLIRGHSGHILRLTTLSPNWWWLSFVLFMKRTFA